MLSVTYFRVITGLIRLRPPKQSVVNHDLCWFYGCLTRHMEGNHFDLFLQFARLRRWGTGIGGPGSHGWTTTWRVVSPYEGSSIDCWI